MKKMKRSFYLRSLYQYKGIKWGKFLMICVLISVTLVNGCKKYDTQNSDPLAQLGLKSVTPADLEDDVVLDPEVILTFSDEAEKSETAKYEVSLDCNGTTLTGLATVSGKTTTYTFDQDLMPMTEYVATISVNPESKSSPGKEKKHSWKFRTGNKYKRKPLSVISVDPVKDAIDVPLNAKLKITMNQVLTSPLKDMIRISLKKGQTAVPGSLAYEGNVVTFTPTGSLEPGLKYSASVNFRNTNDDRDDDDDDDDGKEEDDDDDDDDDDNGYNPYNWSFTTIAGGGTTDNTAPAISSVTPSANATDVALNSPLTIKFSEAMTAATISTSTIALKQGTASVSGSVTYSSSTNTATFTPTAPLSGGTVYIATVSTGVKDAAGNSLASIYSWNFTTAAAAADVTAPTVSSVTPSANATGIALNSQLIIKFSEAMTASTISASTITLKQGAATVAGTVTYASATNTATFTPSAALAAGSTYAATVTTGVKDAAGNALASNYSWSFTTAAAADVTAPTVSSVTPPVNATGIALNSQLIIKFSEAMTASTISASTITLKQGAATVAGTVTFASATNTATFTPSAALAAGSTYAATVTTGVKDAAGNALASNYSWSFTTAAAADVTAPTVSSVTPSANATGVALNSQLIIKFSEAMTASTISASTITLKQGAATVTGTVTFASATNTATFTPSAALAGGTAYTATVTTGVKDAAGNALASNYSWNFTTVAVATGVSFANEVVPILNKCNTCHTHGWNPSATASTFYTNLVNEGYVNPSSPATSKIYKEVSGGHPSSTVTAAEKTKILTWMNEGSKNN